MLILSRRAEQQIVFPHLGIRINVLQVKGQLVKLGVDAPKDIRVVRNELEDRAPPKKSKAAATDGKDLNHALRNELNLLNLKVQALQHRLARGERMDAELSLKGLVDQYSAIDHSIDDDCGMSVADEQGRPARLLVVDDSDNERQLMAYLLASHGFDVQVAADGLIALGQLHATQSMPDFVLMDMQMPYSDGLETLLEIRSSDRLRHLKVFAVTGVRRDPMREPMADGWDGWFQKPLDVNALVKRLRTEVGSACRSQPA